MADFFIHHRLLVCLVLISGPSVVVCAQGVQNGPDFLRGGQYLVQINKGDSTYDPYEIQRSFFWNYDEPEREGIVDVRITVKANGRVSNVELLGGFYDEDFLEQALVGIADSTFKPATFAGKPVAWPALEMRIISRGPFVPALTPGMNIDFRRLVQLNIDGNFTEAEKLATLLLAEQARSLFDYALLHDQLATTYIGSGRLHEALLASRNATSSSKAVPRLISPYSVLGPNLERYIDDYLSPDFFVAALEKRLWLAFTLNQTGEALDTYADIESRTTITDTYPFKPQIEQLRVALAGTEPIGSVAKLIQGKWTFRTSSRRVFGVAGLEGQVDYIDVVCDDSVKKRMMFSAGTEFSLPPGWKNCSLEFHGAAGSQFTLYEYLQ